MEIITQSVTMAPFSLSGLDAIRFVFRHFKNFQISHFIRTLSAPWPRTSLDVTGT